MYGKFEKNQRQLLTKEKKHDKMPKLNHSGMGLRGCSSMVEHQPSKLDTRVRFPSPAPFKCANSSAG